MHYNELDGHQALITTETGRSSSGGVRPRLRQVSVVCGDEGAWPLQTGSPPEYFFSVIQVLNDYIFDGSCVRRMGGRW